MCKNTRLTIAKLVGHVFDENARQRNPDKFRLDKRMFDAYNSNEKLGCRLNNIKQQQAPRLQSASYQIFH